MAAQEKRLQDERLQIRCSSEEKATLQRAADVERRSLSSFVMAAALEKAEKLLNG